MVWIPAGILGLAMAQVALPGTSSVSVAMAPADGCESCHGSFDPAESAFGSWSGSPMAHAARNPLFLSALTEAEKDIPGVGDFCLRCHAPAAWLSGRCVPSDGSALLPEDGGVGCSVCHRMDPSPWQRNGQYVIGEDLVYRGPYDTAAPHAVQRGDWISSAELCGACHDLRNPLVVRRDLDGTSMNMPFPEQTTYTEWASSAFIQRQTCQDCHMPEVEGQVAEQGPVRPDRSRHAFAGGNTFLLAAIDFLEPGLGLAETLARGRARTEAALREAATLEIVDAPEQAMRGAPFSITFRITNETGHKLPTGYPEGRRVWLSVAAPALGLDRGRFDEARGEPIDPVALYRAVHGRYGVGPGHRLALNDTIFEDTRIPPEGMIVTATTAPVGKVYPEVAPGVLAHWDEVTVTATTPCDPRTSEVRVAATLWYQSVTKAYVDALVGENGSDPRGFRLQAAFEEADPGPTAMAEVARTIPIAADSSCSPPDAGVDAGVFDGGSEDRPDAGTPADAGSGTEDVPEEGCGCVAYGRPWGDDGLGGFGLLVLFLGLGLFRGRGSSE